MSRLHLDNLWRWKCGLPETEAPVHVPMDISSLRNSEWSDEFETLMRNRLILGAMRYGLIGANGKPEYDRVEFIKRRLEKYVETGNTEFLVDCANGCLLEFMEGKHPLKHFRATEGEIDHCGVK